MLPNVAHPSISRQHARRRFTAIHDAGHLRHHPWQHQKTDVEVIENRRRYQPVPVAARRPTSRVAAPRRAPRTAGPRPVRLSRRHTQPASARSPASDGPSSSDPDLPPTSSSISSRRAGTNRQTSNYIRNRSNHKFDTSCIAILSYCWGRQQTQVDGICWELYYNTFPFFLPFYIFSISMSFAFAVYLCLLSTRTIGLFLPTFSEGFL